MAEEKKVGLHSLKPAPGSRRSRKRVGRGAGTGHGKTSGRGHKGAGARSGNKRKIAYEGGQNPDDQPEIPADHLPAVIIKGPGVVFTMVSQFKVFHRLFIFLLPQ